MWPGLETCRRKKIVCSWDINDRLDNSTKELEDSIQQNYTTQDSTGTARGDFIWEVHYGGEEKGMEKTKKWFKLHISIEYEKKHWFEKEIAVKNCVI